MGKQSETGLLRFIYSLEGEKFTGCRGRAEEVLQWRAERESTSLMVCCLGGGQKDAWRRGTEEIFPLQGGNVGP